MKKFLAIFLALMMILSVSLVACSEKKKPVDDDENWEGEDTYNPLGTGTADTTKDPDDSTPVVSGGTWTDKNDTVYVLQDTYLRSAPQDNAKTSIVLKANDSVTRLSVQSGSNAKWAKVSYENETYYIYEFIVSTSPINFMPVDRIATTVVNTEATGESTTYLRSTACVASTQKWGDILQNAPLSVTKSQTAGKLVITGYDAANQCARVEYDADGDGAGLAVEYFVYAPQLEYYKNSGGSSNNSGGSNPV